MASWQNSQGRENHKSLWEEPVKDRCLFCGSVEEIKCQMTIQFSEFEYNTSHAISVENEATFSETKQ